uniref:Uncharacterized protein n=1 Tax=Octopus bimaculoides TaxID=37653 RepID=A0A0L8GAW4_OCTBM
MRKTEHHDDFPKMFVHVINYLASSAFLLSKCNIVNSKYIVVKYAIPCISPQTVERMSFIPSYCPYFSKCNTYI